MSKDKVEKAEKSKKEKVEKIVPVYNFTPSEQYQDRKVFTPKGVGFVKGFDIESKRFLLTNKEGKEFDVPEGSVKFKAVDDKYRENYVVDSSVKTRGGSPSINCGDDLAKATLGLVEEELGSIAKENGLEENWNKWKNLNAGQRRMLLGNMLRNRETKEPNSIKIFGRTISEAAENREKELHEERVKAEKEKETKKAEKAKKAKKAKKKPAKDEATVEETVI